MQPTTQLLKFGRGNAKLGSEIHTFSIPAGWSCPGALHCMAKASRITGTITDGSNQQFRCFAATAEAAFPSVRRSRWSNFDLLRAAATTPAMTRLILESLPSGASIVRVHVSGDFFNEAYFLAWMRVAEARPGVRFYAYTKSIHLWKKLQEFVPDNFILTASLGGKYDTSTIGLKTAQVVYSEEQAEALGLQIDHDDTHAYEGKESFALLLHGTQPAGTLASTALSSLRAQGIGGYSTTKK